MVKDFANNNEDIFMELDSFGTICLNYCDIFRLEFFPAHVFLACSLCFCFSFIHFALLCAKSIQLFR